jgi:hypothetical protein
MDAASTPTVMNKGALSTTFFGTVELSLGFPLQNT